MEQDNLSFSDIVRPFPVIVFTNEEATVLINEKAISAINETL